uniref:Uncharacterized protein n=1 Tax=Romanomermis culicivorax TaxID=13658 RepID=A0A915KLY0_ROMCU
MILSTVVVLLAASQAFSYIPLESGNVHRPEILLAKWTPRDIYTLEKICQINEVEKYRRTPFEGTFEDLEYDNIFLNKIVGRKTQREIQHCCNKYTVTEKKQCMKNVRENYLDNYCDKGLDHTCCKTEYENRYTCFAKNPFRRVSPVSPLELEEEIFNTPNVRRMQQERRLLNELAVENYEKPFVAGLLPEDLNEERFSYLEKLEDISGVFRPQREINEILAEEIYGNEREQRRWGRDLDIVGQETLLAESMVAGESLYDNVYEQDRLERLAGFESTADKWETLETLNRVGRRCMTPDCRLESKVELENEILREKIIEGERPCSESHECRRRLEQATKVAAEQVCANKMFRGGRHQTEKCCRAGALVGKMVGRKHREVCTPALFKFQLKSQGCMNNRLECKQTFVECCHEHAERAREERLVEKDYLRHDAIEKELFREQLEQPIYERRFF